MNAQIFASNKTVWLDKSSNYQSSYFGQLIAKKKSNTQTVHLNFHIITGSDNYGLILIKLNHQ